MTAPLTAEDLIKYLSDVAAAAHERTSQAIANGTTSEELIALAGLHVKARSHVIAASEAAAVLATRRPAKEKTR